MITAKETINWLLLLTSTVHPQCDDRFHLNEFKAFLEGSSRSLYVYEDYIIGENVVFWKRFQICLCENGHRPGDDSSTLTTSASRAVGRTCLIVPVQVARPVAQLGAGLHYGLSHLRPVPELLHRDRAVEPVVTRLDQVGVPVVLGPLKVRQHVVEAPAAVAGVAPRVVHARVTARVHHAGHGTGAAHHLAARPRANATGGQARVPLRLRQVPPVQLGAQGRGGERRHRRGGGLLGARLQQAHRPTGHLA